MQEVHILHDFASDFYGLEIRVVVLGYVRPEYNYDSMGEYNTLLCSQKLGPQSRNFLSWRAVSKDLLEQQTLTSLSTISLLLTLVPRIRDQHPLLPLVTFASIVRHNHYISLVRHYRHLLARHHRLHGSPSLSPSLAPTPWTPPNYISIPRHRRQPSPSLSRQQTP